MPQASSCGSGLMSSTRLGFPSLIMIYLESCCSSAASSAITLTLRPLPYPLYPAGRGARHASLCWCLAWSYVPRSVSARRAPSGACTTVSPSLSYALWNMILNAFCPWKALLSSWTLVFVVSFGFAHREWRGTMSAIAFEEALSIPTDGVTLHSTRCPWL